MSSTIRITNDFFIFDDKCRILADCLERAGFAVSIEREVPTSRLRRWQRRDEIWIGYWNHVPLDRLPRRYIAMQSEPMRVEDAWWTEQPEWIPMLRGAIEVWDYHDTNRSVVEQLGPPFCFLPCGYSPLHEQWHAAAVQEVGEPDIDVLFIGGEVPRRTEAVARLRASGLRVMTCGYDLDGAVYGPEMHRLVARAKLFLGIHRYDDPSGHILDLFRFDHSLANGLPILHERLHEASAFDQQFLDRIPFYDLPDIVGAVHAILEDLPAAQAFAQDSAEWFRREHPVDRYIPTDRLRRLMART